MKYSTQYNRVERRTYTFSEADILKALRAAIKASLFSDGKPAAAMSDSWTMEIELHDQEEYRPVATVTQTFEYGDEPSKEGTP